MRPARFARGWRRGAVGVAVCCGALAHGGAASAQHGGDAARRAFEEGVRALQTHHPEDAAASFEASYRLRAVPMVLYNLGLARRAAGQNREAVQAFERFLANPGDDLSPAQLSTVRQETEALRAALAQVQITLEPRDATVQVDGREEHLEGDLLVLNPGRHVVDFHAAGRVSQQRAGDAAAGSRLQWRIVLAPIPARAASEGPTRAVDDGRDRQRVGLPPRDGDGAPTPTPRSGGGWVLPVVIVGGALLAAGIGVGVWALTRDQGVDPPPTTTGWTIESIHIR